MTQLYLLIAWIGGVITGRHLPRVKIVKLDKDRAEVLRRLESGEDPDSIIQSMPPHLRKEWEDWDRKNAK